MRSSCALLVVAIALCAVARADTTVPWDEAEKHVGEETTVEGRVLGVHCSQLSCLLAFDPTFNRFTAVIQAESFDTFPPAELDHRYSGKRVRVHGKIQTRDGKPEIVVAKGEELALVPSKKRDEHEERVTQAQTEAIERLGEVLAHIEELTERMVATQERVEGLLAQLEQTQAALAAAQAQQGAPAAEPSYGEPQPRPAYEQLRTVKRGMSRADVERLIGQPIYVDNGTGGWSTWYYGYGRSVSFDTRGRAQSLLGFPAP
jgi:SmpA/OmlA family protein